MDYRWDSERDTIPSAIKIIIPWAFLLDLLLFKQIIPNVRKMTMKMAPTTAPRITSNGKLSK